MRRPRLVTALLVPILGSLLIGSAAVGIIVHDTVERDLRTSLDDELDRALTAQANRPQPTSGPFPEADDTTPFRFTVRSDGSIVRASDLALAEMAREAVLTHDGPVTIMAEPDYRFGSRTRPDGDTVVVGLPMTTLERSLDSLRRNLFLGGVLLIVVQSAVALIVARMLQRTTGHLRSVAHRIAEGDLDAHPGPGTGPRETFELAADLRTMVDRLRHTIDERAEAAATAERARATMARFLADASHELLTPLTALTGYSNLYAAGMLDAEGLDRAMARIGAESERLAKLSRDLLHVVRTDPERETVDLAAVASGVVHDLRAANPERRIRLENASTPALTAGDPARLHQAILNLAANACQHTPPDTPVLVRLERSLVEVEVHVVDEGPGIDPDQAEAVFAPFARGDASRSRHTHDGAGLGLAIVASIAAQHMGSVTVQPGADGGSDFVFRVPALK